MTRMQSDALGPQIQDMAIETTEPAPKIYEQGSSLTVLRVSGHKGVTVNEIAGTFARKVAMKTHDNESRKSMKRKVHLSSKGGWQRRDEALEGT